jgi:hypothetical protein
MFVITGFNQTDALKMFKGYTARKSTPFSVKMIVQQQLLHNISD